MSSQTVYPATVTTDGATSSIPSSLTWSNPSYAEGGGSFTGATALIEYDPSTGFPGHSKGLMSQGCGFSIPAGATINGIVVTLSMKCDTTDVAADYDVTLLRAGSRDGSTTKSFAGTTGLPTTATTRTFGSSSDLWGASWSASDVNNSGFGFDYAAQSASETINPSDAPGTVYVYYTQVTVYYTPASDYIASGTAGATGAATLVLASALIPSGTAHATASATAGLSSVLIASGTSTATGSAVLGTIGFVAAGHATATGAATLNLAMGLVVSAGTVATATAGATLVLGYSARGTAAATGSAGLGLGMALIPSGVSASSGFATLTGATDPPGSYLGVVGFNAGAFGLATMDLAIAMFASGHAVASAGVTLSVEPDFNPALAADVRVAIDDAADLVISWTSLAPDGTAFQVYIDGVLAWKGYSTFCVVPPPVGPAYIVVGAVLPASYGTGFGGDLPLPPGGGGRVTLNWLGGTYLAPDIRGFRVYGSDTPGGAVDTAKVLATIPAYAGQILDGFGQGGFGQGGFGLAAGAYSWTSGPLASGVWTYEVTSYDAAGNENKLTGSTTTATILGPPREPGPFSDGTRLHKSWNAATKQVTLTWNASP